jgi:S-adenosylmethionine:diacylglycerol 3-amino-3-carboxypropyl transferase
VSDIHFAQIREDGRLERHLMQSHHPRRIVCVASGGCTALSLLDRAEIVHAVDASPAQCALVELRKAALGHLSRQDYLAFIGDAPSDDRLADYARLAPSLPAYAREFWDARPELITEGINGSGTTEGFYRFVGRNLRASVIPDAVWEQLFACDSIEQQRALYARHFDNEAWHLALRLLLSRTTHLAFFPAAWFASAREHDFGAFFAAQFEKEVTTRVVKGNYFLSQLLFARYRDEEPEGTPPYLTRENYEAIRNNLDRLVIVPAPLEQYLAELSGIDGFFLSNVCDWADASSRQAIASGILRAGVSGAVVLHRNLLGGHSPADELGERLRVDASESAHLHKLERSMMYRKIEAGALA